MTGRSELTFTIAETICYNDDLIFLGVNEVNVKFIWRNLSPVAIGSTKHYTLLYKLSYSVIYKDCLISKLRF